MVKWVQAEIDIIKKHSTPENFISDQELGEKYLNRSFISVRNKRKLMGINVHKIYCTYKEKLTLYNNLILKNNQLKEYNKKLENNNKELEEYNKKLEKYYELINNKIKELKEKNIDNIIINLYDKPNKLIQKRRKSKVIKST